MQQKKSHDPMTVNTFDEEALERLGMFPLAHRVREDTTFVLRLHVEPWSRPELSLTFHGVEGGTRGDGLVISLAALPMARSRWSEQMWHHVATGGSASKPPEPYSEERELFCNTGRALCRRILGFDPGRIPPARGGGHDGYTVRVDFSTRDFETTYEMSNLWEEHHGRQYAFLLWILRAGARNLHDERSKAAIAEALENTLLPDKTWP